MEGWYPGVEQGKYSFNIRKDSRWFNMTVTVNNDDFIAGEFSNNYSNENLKEVLQGLGFTLKFSFTVKGNKIITNDKK